MTDNDFSERILSDLERIERKVDGHARDFGTFVKDDFSKVRERLSAVEVRAGIIATVAAVIVLLLRQAFK